MDVLKSQRKYLVDMEDHVVKEVKMFTHSGHVILPKSWIGESVIVLRNANVLMEEEKQR